MKQALVHIRGVGPITIVVPGDAYLRVRWSFSYLEIHAYRYTKTVFGLTRIAAHTLIAEFKQSDVIYYTLS